MNDHVRALGTGWLVRGTVPGPDVDEFGEPDQITRELARPGAADGTLLAVQHPHRTPTAIAENRGLLDAVPIAEAALGHLRAQHYRRVHDVVALSWGDGPGGEALGVQCVVDPTAVLPGGLTFVRHTEDVYPEVVAERAAMQAALRCATSAAMLVPADGGAAFTALLKGVVAELGEPEVSIVDKHGRDRIWLLGKGDLQDTVLTAIRRHPLLVADGNHRVAAATLAGNGLLALVTDGPDLRIGPINRVFVHTSLAPGELVERWRAAGLDIQPANGSPAPGTVVVLAGLDRLAIRLPGPGIDHQKVEQLMVERALGRDPAEVLRPLYVGQQPRPDADAVVLIAPVPLDHVLSGRRMPRKATYFTPKPRSGLVLADLR
ncbi:DUF1015 family protein [Actinocrispum wychmicini]|uniref:DUF1015 family protein n=1 Tax=Actinocrispum wychmicini TaxID=1213861 RepID=UPI001404458C|nr:DUF1015 family protein [Actinocrispum wychmicini]